MALREARREKIHLFCVTVDREGADYLPAHVLATRTS